MRRPRHLSPTSFDLWERDKEQFYQQYLSDRRFDKDPQTMPMAIGSAFDYLVKKHLMGALPASKLSAKAEGMLKAQIDDHNLPEAMEHGHRVFELYHKSGALAALMNEIVTDARFEFGITGCFKDGVLRFAQENISHEQAEKEVGTTYLLLNGRPDGVYKTRTRFTSPLVDVVHDFKVNSWLATAKSPDPGFIAIHTHDGRVLGHHKDAYIAMYNDVRVNKSLAISNTWSKQLAIYGWCMGVPIGTPMIGSIDQIIGPSDKGRVAKHRFLIQETFQRELYGRILECWSIINSDWILRDMPREASIARCAALETQVVFDIESNVDLSDIAELSARER